MSIPSAAFSCSPQSEALAETSVYHAMFYESQPEREDNQSIVQRPMSGRQCVIRSARLYPDI